MRASQETDGYDTTRLLIMIHAISRIRPLMVLQPELMARTKENILAILNTGSVKDLMALHQIGKKKANRIVAWRGEHGSFEKVEDLGKVEGISAKQVASFLKLGRLAGVGSVSLSPCFISLLSEPA
uniref:Kinesin family member 22 n=1 Tax=Podarcis muralis TaxID=64176 RepID=A0A670JD83_PODMU